MLPTIWAKNNDCNPRDVVSRNFAFDMAMQILTPYIEARNLKGLQSNVVKSIELVLGKPAAHNNERLLHSNVSVDRKRCHSCLESIHGDNFKMNKSKLPKKTTCCQKCGEVTCKEHLITLCKECFDN